MINNLFSIFDSSTNTFIDLNWFSSLSNLLILPLFYWLFKSRKIFLFLIILSIIFNEFKNILNNKFNYINTIILTSLFFFILLTNFLGIFPYIFTSSRHLIFSLRFSIPLWLRLILFGWINNTTFIFSHIIPQGTPRLLMPFIVIIETIRNIIRPRTLAIRLTANIIAGHLLLTLLSQTASSTIIIISFIIIFIQIILLILEFSVSIIQSYVFVILIRLYSKETN